jgi:hypothetical protein
MRWTQMIVPGNLVTSLKTRIQMVGLLLDSLAKIATLLDISAGGR